MNIQDHIRIVPDFPKPGINFYDIATLLAHPVAWRATVAALYERIHPYKPDMLMGVESRGFLVAAPLALELGCGFGMIRKKGKLPGKTLEHSYDLEYGSDTIELQPDLIKPGTKVVIVDDLLATGGTLAASESLLKNAGAEVIANLCIIELEGLNGRDKLSAPFEALLKRPA
ncbi:MAG: adenine phosphoribosyltransferase [Alphaproteobacteria bacterium]